MDRPLAEPRMAPIALPAMLAVACLANAAAGQGAVGGSQLPERVDGGVADRHSLGQSLRVQPVDLSPHGFQNVYKVPGRDDLLMRTDGALYAVFDQSVYVRDPRQKNAVVMKPMIPAATVFYIGKPDFRMIRSSGVRDLSFRREDAPRGTTAHGLDGVPGVSRLDPHTGTSAATPIPGDKLDGKHVAHDESDHSFPPLARDPAGRPPVAPPVAPPEEPAPTRAERPGFDRRIDELMERAKKAPPATP